MKSTPYISIIIPAFNEGKYIERCLNSVSIQSCRFPYEIIIANNNSSDTTVEICKKYNVRIVNEKRKGYVYAAIKGIGYANAPIIAMTDADTIVPYNWLEEIYKTYSSQKDAIAVGGGFEYYDGPIIIRCFIKFINSINPKILVSSLSGMNMSFKKASYIKVGGFSEHINLQADTYLGNKFYTEGRVIFLKKNTVRSSARRLKTFLQIMYELYIRIANAIHLKLFNQTIFKHQSDYR